MESMPGLQEATELDVKNYIDGFRYHADNLSGYESAYMDKLEELALAHKNLNDVWSTNETPEKIAEHELLKVGDCHESVITKA